MFLENQKNVYFIYIKKTQYISYSEEKMTKLYNFNDSELCINRHTFMFLF